MVQTARNLALTRLKKPGISLLHPSLPHLLKHSCDVSPNRGLALVHPFPLLVDQMHDDGERELVDPARQFHLDLPADDAVTSDGQEILL